MKKHLVLVAGIMTQLCLGSIYAWSAIGEALNLEYSLASWQTQLIYGTAIGIFAFGTIITGRLLKKIGPGKLTLFSAILFALSFTAASFSGGSFIILLLSLGLGLGAAMAMGYVVPLSTATAWFPKIKGTVTGLAVMGFGGGAIITGNIFKLFLEQGHGILSILLPFGLICGAVLFLSSTVQSFPEDAGQNGSRQHHPIHAIFASKTFWIMAISMFLATAGGLIVIGKVTGIANDYGLSSYGLLALSLLAAGNAGGRLLWGFLADVLKKKTILLSFVVMIIGFVLLMFSNGNVFIFLTGVLLTGLQFGASLVVFAAFTEKHFGDGAIAKVYPFIFSFYGIAALIGPFAGGLAYDFMGSYTVLLSAMTVLAVLGFALNVPGAIKKESK